MEREDEKRPDERAMDDEAAPVGIEQNGAHFTAKDEIHAGDGMTHHGRPLSEMEIEELRIHKANNEFLGIPDVPEKGTGSGNHGGVIPDASDFDSADELDEVHTTEGRDGNFGRNYMGGIQSQDHFIEESRKDHKKKEEKKK